MEQICEIDGLQLHYDVSGQGRPLILMHGWGCDSSTVASIARTASQTHRVYSLDLPGFGSTPEPPEAWNVEEYTSLVEKLADRLGIDNPVLAGNSFGGRIAILFASRRQADKLILIDAAGVKPRRGLRYYFKVYAFKFSRRIMQLTMGKEAAARKIEEGRRRNGSADYAAASPRMRAVLSKVVNHDLRRVMPSIKAPTLLIWGENDTATPMRDARIMERLIPGAALVSFPGCGHYSFLDNPRQFAAVMSSFLKS